MFLGLINILMQVMLVLCFYLFVRKHTSPRVALVAAALYDLSPVTYRLADYVLWQPSTAMPFVWAGLAAISYADKPIRLPLWMLGCVLCIIGVSFYLPVLLIAPLIVWTMYVSRGGIRSRAHRIITILTGTGAALVLFFPTITQTFRWIAATGSLGLSTGQMVKHANAGSFIYSLARYLIPYDVPSGIVWTCAAAGATVYIWYVFRTKPRELHLHSATVGALFLSLIGTLFLGAFEFRFLTIAPPLVALLFATSLIYFTARAKRFGEIIITGLIVVILIGSFTHVLVHYNNTFMQQVGIDTTRFTSPPPWTLAMSETIEKTKHTYDREDVRFFTVILPEGSQTWESATYLAPLEWMYDIPLTRIRQTMTAEYEILPARDPILTFYVCHIADSDVVRTCDVQQDDEGVERIYTGPYVTIDALIEPAVNALQEE